MDLSKKSCQPSASSPALESPPLLSHPYSLDIRHTYHPYMMHPPHSYLVDPALNVPPYYTMIPQRFLPAMPAIKLEPSSGYLEQRQYHDFSEDTRSNASSSHDDHLPDSSTKSSDSEKDLNCNRLSHKNLLKPSSRPFKAINPMGLTLNSFSFDSAEYEEFRKKMLSQVENASTTNKNMRRTIQSANPKYGDPGYVEKRKRNNEAAKRSRDARRAKEDEIAIRCAFLEQENIKLKIQLANIEKQKKMLIGLGH